jgi:hypothetical protein
VQVLDGGPRNLMPPRNANRDAHLRRVSPEPGSILDRERNQVVRRRLAPPVGARPKVLSV